MLAARFAFVLFASLLFVPSAPGQRTPDPFNSINSTVNQTRTYESQGAVLILTVYGDGHKLLDRQSVVKLENQGTHITLWQTTNDQSQATFVDVTSGTYEIEVSAVGYLTQRKPFLVGSNYSTSDVQFSLERDPTAVDLSEPNASALLPKARKITQKGVRSLKSGNLKEAQKQLEQAYKLAPNSPAINFLLGYLYFQRQDYPQAQNFLAKAATGDRHNVPALTLLGRVRLQRGEIDSARATLEDAVAAGPEDWMAHKYLADAYLKNRVYEKARAQAQLVIDHSKAAANSAQLVLGQALANLGKSDEAIAALETFLRNAPNSSNAPQVRNLIDQIRNRDLSAISKNVLVDDTEVRLSMKAWVPPGIDDVKPPVSKRVSCPEGQVISEAGFRVKELVNDISKFAAVEHLLHENVDEMGNPLTTETRHYNYIAGISELQPGMLEVEEYRTQDSSPAQFPDNMASRGFPALALVFHPDMWQNFTFNCEGMGDLHGRPTWLVRFQQRDDRPNYLQDFKIGGRHFPVSLKGRAWITPDKFQIVRMESEMVKPMPEIQLLTEHQIIEYGPVQFSKKNVELWLPKSAELYFDFRKRRIHRKHSFDHFMLFSTDTEEKVGGPKVNPELPASKTQENP